MKEKSMDDIDCGLFYKTSKSECISILQEALKKGLFYECETCNNNPTVAESLPQEANETSRKRTPSFMEPASKKEMSEESKTLLSFIMKTIKDDLDNNREPNLYCYHLYAIGRKNGDIFKILQLLDAVSEYKGMKKEADKIFKENLTWVKSFNKTGGPLKSAAKLIKKRMLLLPTDLTDSTANAINKGKNKEILDFKERLDSVMNYYPQSLEDEVCVKPEEIAELRNRVSAFLKKKIKEIVSEIVATGFSENEAYKRTLYLLHVHFPEIYPDPECKSDQNSVRYAYLTA